MTVNAGSVSVGIRSDTAEFAMQSIRCWRERMGRQHYANAPELKMAGRRSPSATTFARRWGSMRTDW
jgi:Rhodopirellula transposase DDE domain